MGFLTLPNDVENCYLSSMGYQWVEKEVLIDELNEKYNELEVQEFEGIPTKYYLLFFTTELANQQYKDWEHLMMVVGETNKSKPFGNFQKFCKCDMNLILIHLHPPILIVNYPKNSDNH